MGVRGEKEDVRELREDLKNGKQNIRRSEVNKENKNTDLPLGPKAAVILPQSVRGWCQWKQLDFKRLLKGMVRTNGRGSGFRTTFKRFFKKGKNSVGK